MLKCRGRFRERCFVSWLLCGWLWLALANFAAKFADDSCSQGREPSRLLVLFGASHLPACRRGGAEEELLTDTERVSYTATFIKKQQWQQHSLRVSSLSFACTNIRTLTSGVNTGHDASLISCSVEFVWFVKIILELRITVQFGFQVQACSLLCVTSWCALYMIW